MADNIRSFRAASVADALAQIRREMGHEAVVVETKQLSGRGIFSWFGTQSEVQVTASVGTSNRRSSKSQRNAGSQPLVMQPTTQGTVAAAAAQARRSAASASVRTLPDAVTLTPLGSGDSRTFQTVDEVDVQSRLSLRERTSFRGAKDDNRGPVPSEFREIIADCVQANEGSKHEAHSRSMQTISSPESIVESRRPCRTLAASATRTVSSPEPIVESPPSDLEQRLDSLHKMIAELGRQSRPRGLVEIPPGLFAHYLALIEGDVEDEIARELIAKLQQHATPEQLDNTASTTSLLTALVEREIRCTEPLLPKRGYRRVAMLVGPTGVGKTTTIAKLAGRFGLEGDLRVGLITVDTYRVAAVEQLRTYAEIIDLPLQVVSSPAELPAALEQFAEFDLVLIDTAGRSPHDDRQLEELKQLIAAASPDDICLVLSLASGAKALRSTADRFAAVRPTSLILTKLDEAAGCGGLLSVSRDIAIPISYFTLGQEVPRDIEPANACRAARLVLGRDRLGHQPEA